MDLNTFYSVLAAATATLLGLLFLAIQLNQGKGSDGTETNIAVALVILFIIVLRNSWQLLVELPSESMVRKQGWASSHREAGIATVPGC